MNTSYITSSTMQTLKDKHPAAYNLLVHENLKEEARRLIREMAYARDVRRANWITSRLEELEAIGII